MWFRNLQILRADGESSLTADELEEQLRRTAFQPAGAYAMDSTGWIPPRGDDRLVHSAQGHWLIALGMEQKLLPASVIRQEVKNRAVEIEQRMGVKPGRKRLKDLKEEVTGELLPRAFSRYSTTFAWIDRTAGWLVLDAASPKKGEDFLSTLRRCMDEFPFAPLECNRSPASAMAEWLAAGDAPGGFGIEGDCELRAATQEKQVVRYANHPLDTPEIRKHLADGKQVAKLALTWRDRVSFVLTDTLAVKRLSFLDLARAEAGSESESDQDRFDADFALMTGLVGQLLGDLTAALGGRKTA